MPRRKTPDHDAARFGAIIRRLRDERGWTLLDFGRKADMNATYLGFIERGENIPSLTTILRLARVFAVKASDLLKEIEG